MKVGLEKLESHEEVMVKALLDSGATDLFIDIYSLCQGKRI